MATPAQVANDLDAQSKRFARTQFPCVSKSCARGAETIRELLARINDLEAVNRDLDEQLGDAWHV
tara:strand:+ start:2837 stop:3031 length:195 start_codon:yes stop_codon:yes gene_type:complete